MGVHNIKKQLMCELIEFDLFFFCQTKYLQIGKFTYGFIQKHVQNKRLCRMEVVLVYKTLRCVFFSVSFYQFAVDFFHFLYFIIMFDSICFYAHQIGLRAGFNSTQYGLILHPFYGRFVLHSTTTKNRHSGLLMAI